jgi:hypothetical protein
MTQTAGSTKKSPEWLARYCDTLLRKGFVKIGFYHQNTISSLSVEVNL